MTQIEKVTAKLDELKIEYKLVHHEKVTTMEEIEATGLFNEGEMCKNLFLRNANGKTHYVVSMFKNKHPDIQNEIRTQLSCSRLSFGSDERLMKHLGLLPGAVGPFGIINDENAEVNVVLDSDLKTYDGLIGFHPNDNSATVWLRFNDLMKFINDNGNDVYFIKI